LGLAEGGGLEARSFNLAQMLNEALHLHFWQTLVSGSGSRLNTDFVLGL